MKNVTLKSEDVWINEEHRVIIKNKDILKVLTSFKFKTYKAEPNMIHFKDVFMKLVKRKFQEEVKEFQVSKHLKTRMKSEWEGKHRKVGKANRTGFDAHQAYAASVIQKYAIKRFRNKEKKVTIDKSQFAKYSYVKSKMAKSKDDPFDPSQEQLVNKVAPELDISSSDGLQLVDEFGQIVGGFNKNSSHGPGQPVAKNRNTDENPQEFEEVSQEMGPGQPNLRAPPQNNQRGHQQRRTRGHAGGRARQEVDNTS